ncbi:MAG: hypothetical protein QXH81_10515 [Thermofilaceae archaeon]
MEEETEMLKAPHRPEKPAHIEIVEGGEGRVPLYIETMTNILMEEKKEVEDWIYDLQLDWDVGLQFARTELKRVFNYSGVIDFKPRRLRRVRSPASIEWNCSLEWCVVKADIPVPEESAEHPRRRKEDVVLGDVELEHGCRVESVHEHRVLAETHVHLLCDTLPSGLKGLLERLVKAVAEGEIRFTE